MHALNSISRSREIMHLAVSVCPFVCLSVCLSVLSCSNGLTYDPTYTIFSVRDVTFCNKPGVHYDLWLRNKCWLKLVWRSGQILVHSLVIYKLNDRIELLFSLTRKWVFKESDQAQAQVPICGWLMVISWCVTLSGCRGWLLIFSNYFLHGDIGLFCMALLPLYILVILTICFHHAIVK